MKPKYFSFVAVLLAILTVGFACWHAVTVRTVDRAGDGFAPIKPLSELKVPDDAVLRKMDAFQRSMHQLSMPPKRARQEADLSILGYLPMSDPGVSGGVSNRKGLALPTYNVTLAFEGQGRRFCVIDSELYPEGAVLPDGSTILKIESRRVLIAKEQRQQWLVVESLLDSALPDRSEQGVDG